ncbi:MAG: YajQ family cyclic di-GMP-binding protein [Candidatus Omnitrophota bacterium]|nr:YajQ family cyclic di-GMP-binding protein [Candidatus Omnitrophota bacterium]MBU1929054.1 YajQ family cyclic di-GMP-binding protein [Candidatus Omnitrophota bacterium]MBU2034395.1 YajQ family cyclic di-GMP-binding protein [Candidatus Omnitrophota bacterium]MBU2221701.1 YajQ family cyclic di-GMP-binding protein [Candidatus Omnitrophota bacterium]
MANFSFDIVSEVNLQEMDNAVNQANKELAQRYDFKDSLASIAYDRKEKTITLIADDNFKLRALTDILSSRMAKRGISLKSLKFSEPEKAFEGYLRQQVEICTGIDKEKAKELVGIIKKLGLKVQTQIEGEKIKVSSPKKDELQTVIVHLRGLDFPLPLNFCNYR